MDNSWLLDYQESVILILNYQKKKKFTTFNKPSVYLIFLFICGYLFTPRIKLLNLGIVQPFPVLVYILLLLVFKWFGVQFGINQHEFNLLSLKYLRVLTNSKLDEQTILLLVDNMHLGKNWHVRHNRRWSLTTTYYLRMSTSYLTKLQFC